MNEDGHSVQAGRPVVGTLLNPSGDTQARRLASALAADADSRVRLVTMDDEEAPDRRVVEVGAEGATVRLPQRASGSPTTGADSVERVVAEATAADADVVTLQRATAESGSGVLRRATTDRLVASLETDIVVANGAGSLESLASILVPVAGGRHTDLAVRTARALGRQTGAWVELFHVVPEGTGTDTRLRGEACLAEAQTGLADFDQHDTWLYEGSDPASAIAEQSRYYDAVVMGAPEMGRIRRMVFGSTLDAVDERVDVPIVTAISAPR
jgi:nucleotide-binding universal stress UspA family protein